MPSYHDTIIVPGALTIYKFLLPVLTLKWAVKSVIMSFDLFKENHLKTFYILALSFVNILG